MADIVSGCKFIGSSNYKANLPDLLSIEKSTQKITAKIGLKFLCTPGTNATASIDLGEHSHAGTWGLATTVQGDNEIIPYQIFYVNSGKKILWNKPISFTGLDSSNPMEIEFDVKTPMKAPMTGMYTDTDIITISY